MPCLLRPVFASVAALGFVSPAGIIFLTVLMPGADTDARQNHSRVCAGNGRSVLDAVAAMIPLTDLRTLHAEDAISSLTKPLC